MVNVVAKNFAQEDKLDKILELEKELIKSTREEEGCIKYALYQDENDPLILTMLEEWESKEALERHLKSEHFARIVPLLNKLMRKQAELNIYNKII